ncbi:alpha/beta fold hydrolase [Pseudochryseolinea flava]|uniref:AB hydrolase-1 domain-containing protein n=1 Tax=Pseudochryseolinea flava TaxID=2059302 RepID=A0A364Y2G3_9BACT|nr:alpha/beta hydrolase [Pseudochryseolinea flava]RAW00946.1 hypothetical protein DQQ10_11950 [Pseudochryseolinea flava]
MTTQNFNGHRFVDEGNGSTVVLVGGIFTHADFWKSSIDFLKVEHRVIIPLMPYYDVPFEYLSLKYFSKILHDFIYWRGLTDVTIVAHGVGAQVALLYNHFNPLNVRRLVLSGMNSAAKAAPRPEPSFLELADKRHVSSLVKEAFFDPRQVPMALVDSVYNTLQNIPRRLAVGALLRASQRIDLSNQLQHNRTPTLLVWGLDDKLTPPEHALHSYDILSHASLKFIKHCGHVPMVEQPAEFNQLVNDFIRVDVRSAVGY